MTKPTRADKAFDRLMDALDGASDELVQAVTEFVEATHAEQAKQLRSMATMVERGREKIEAALNGLRAR